MNSQSVDHGMQESCTISYCIFQELAPSQTSSTIQTTMCRQIKRYHLSCEHWHTFWTIECKTLKTKKEKWLQKRDFWSRLLGSKPTCKTDSIKESKYYWCPFCTRAHNFEYPSDGFGEDLIAAGNEREVTYESKFREELLRGGPSRQDLTMPDLPPNLRNSFLELPSSQSKNRPRQQLPEIRSNIVNPGIDFERWSHVQDHILPPRSGPPPDKPLPPTPRRHHPVDVRKQLAPASKSQEHHKTGQQIQRNPVTGQSGESYPGYNSRQVDGPAEAISPLPRPQTRPRETPLPLILDKDRELPDILPWIPDTPHVSPLTPSFLQDAEFSGQESQTPATPVRRGGSATNRSWEKPNKYQSSLVSPQDCETDTPIARYVVGSNRRAKTICRRHKDIRSVHVDRAYISPGLEQDIDDVENYWMTGGAGSSENNFQIPKMAETEPVQHKGKRKAKAGGRVKFDDFVRDDTR